MKHTILSLVITFSLLGCEKDEHSPIYEGDLVLVTQQDVDDFAASGIKEVNGVVSIGRHLGGNPVGGVRYPSTVSDLDGLRELTSIKSSLIIDRNNALLNLDGLSNLTFIGGDWLLKVIMF